MSFNSKTKYSLLNFNLERTSANSIKNLLYLITILVILISLPSYSKASIIPDAIQPILVVPPNISSLESDGTKIVFKFSTDSNFEGLSDNQAISIKFHGTSAVVMEKAYDCTVEVKDSGDNVVGINTITATPNIDDKKSVFCIMSNEETLPSSSIYYFKITLNIKQTLPVHKIRSVWIAFSNSTNVDRILMSPTELVATTPHYDVGTVENSIMTITEVEKINLTPPSSCSSPCGVLYPYNTFQVSINLTINNYFNTKQDAGAVLAISWPNSDFDFTGATISSEKGVSNSSEPLHSALIPTSGNTIGLAEYIGIKNTYKITNLNEDMYSGRKFKLIISGITSPDYVTTDAQNEVANLHFLIYYSNDYSRFGSLSTSDLLEEPIFKVNRAPIIMATNNADWNGIANAEMREIYENASWPMRFVFNLPPMPLGGYVRIEHEYDTNKIFHFISSTCDFSDKSNSSSNVNENLSLLLGQRPICYSTVSSLIQENSSGNNIANSGFYFKVPQSFNTSVISLIVWGLAAKCSENNYLDSSSPSYLNIYDSSDLAKNSKKLSFNISAYNKIDLSKLSISNDSIFDDINKVAYSGSIGMYKECHGSLISYKTSHNNYDLKPFYSDSSTISATSDVLLYKEFHDWSLSSLSTADGDLNFLDSSKYYYIYENPNTVYDIEFGVNLDSTLNAPVNAYLNNGSLTLFQGYLSFYFSRGFLSTRQNAAACKLLWFNSNLSEVTSSNYNLIGEDTSLADDLEFDSNSNAVDAGYLTDVTTFANPIFIQSKDMDTDVTNNNNKAKFIINKTSQHLGFQTNCYKIGSSFTRKSIYSYIDFTYTLTRVDGSSNYFVNRVGRFVKLYPSIGVFNSPDYVVSSTNSAYFYFAFASGTDELCLLKLESELFYSGMTDDIIAINLINIRLLDLDSTNLASTYPVAPLASNVLAYSENTTYQFSFLYASDFSSLLNKQFNDTYSPIALPYSYSDYVKNPDNYDYYNYFGSIIYFKNNSGNNGIFTADSPQPQIDTYLPVYCPKGGEMIDNKDQYSFVIPSISAYSLSFTGDDVSNIAGPVKNIKFNLNSGSTDGIGTTALLFKRGILEPASASLSNKINLYFSEYTTSSILGTQRLYVKGIVPVNGIPPEMKCSSMTLFLTDLIQYESSIDFNGISVSAKYLNTDGYGFYYKGKRFTKAFMYGIGSSDSRIFIPGTVTGTDEFPSYSGIDRPSITQFVSSNPSLENDIALQCIRISTSGDGSGRFYNNWDSSNEYFSTEFQKLQSDDNYWTVNVTTDQASGIVFQNDPALKVNFEVSVPSQIPKIAEIHLISEQLTTNSLCAINNYNINFPAVACSSITDSTVTCPLSSATYDSNTTETLDICCFNMQIQPDVEVIIQNKSSITLDDFAYSMSYLYRDIISGDADEDIQYTTGYISNTSSSALITSITPTVIGLYSDQVYQLNGLGSLIIHINLGRPIVPYQRIKIKGSLSKYFISNNTPGCTFMFSDISTQITDVDSTDLITIRAMTLNNSNYSKGNYLVDHCEINTTTIETTQHFISLYNKNYIYKCKILDTPYQYAFIKISPVIIVDLNSNTDTETYNSTSYNVNQYYLFNGIMSFDEANKITATNTAVFPAPLIYTTNSSLQTVNNLCDVFNIAPATIGSSAEYIFKIDLTNVTSFNYDPNEVTIYLDPLLFPYPSNTQLSLVKCYLDSSSTNVSYCNWNKQGFFNVGLNVNLNTETIYYIKISNIINSSLDTSYKFQCSLNKVTDQANYTNPKFRINEIIGNGVNAFYNYFIFAEPDASVFSSSRSNPSPLYTPYLKIRGPDNTGLFTVEHTYDELSTFPEQFETRIYFIYNNSSGTLTDKETEMLSNFNSLKELYENNTNNNGRYLFYVININTDVADQGATLLDSFITPSFRVLTPTWKQYALASDGNDLESFLTDSINDYYLNNIFPYFSYSVENDITTFKNEYSEPYSLQTSTKIYFIYIDGDTSALYTNFNTQYSSFSYTGKPSYWNVDAIIEVKVTDSTKYRLTNLSTFSFPSFRIVLPNGVMKSLVDDSITLVDYLDEIFTAYYGFEEALPDLVIPIFQPTVYLFTHSAGTNVNSESNDSLYCRYKYSSDLTAAFYQFKNYYDDLNVISSFELEYVDIDMNNSLCDGKIDFDNNVWPSIAIYLPNGSKFTYVPSLPDVDNSESCNHYNHFWDVYNLVNNALKYYIGKDDLLNSQIQNNDAVIVFAGNSFKDEKVFNSVITESSVYLPYFFCSLESCLDYFRISNGDVLLINSENQPYIEGSTDVKVLSNGYTTIQLSNFLKESYNPLLRSLNNDVLYQIFYKRKPALIVMIYNDINTSTVNTYLNLAKNASVELRVSTFKL